LHREITLIPQHPKILYFSNITMPQLRLEQLGTSKKSISSFPCSEGRGKNLDDSILFALLMPTKVEAAGRTFYKQSGNGV
jgi:hypothetical protein